MSIEASENLSKNICFNFTKFTNDPSVVNPNIPVEDQEIETKEELPKIEEKASTSSSGKIYHDVIDIKESQSVMEELKSAIEMCRHSTERKTLDDDEVHELWFNLLDVFIPLQRALRYGFFGKVLLCFENLIYFRWFQNHLQEHQLNLKRRIFLIQMKVIQMKKKKLEMNFKLKLKKLEMKLQKLLKILLI